MSDAEWRRLLAEKDARIAELEATIAELRAALEKLTKNSLNSSLPPSRDDREAREKRRERAAKHARRRKKEARKKNRSKRSLLPPERVTSSEEHHPSRCFECGTRLRRADMLDEPERLQQLELEEIRLLVHEVVIHSGQCPCCETVTRAAQPTTATESKVGPTLRALLMLLIGRFHLSRREALEFLSDVVDVDLSLGLLSMIESQTAEALAPVVSEAAEAVKDAPVVHADETSWSVGGVPHWLWVATTGPVAVFSIAPGRGSADAHVLLGDREDGVTVVDRWVAYAKYGKRQLCWAHLERNTQAVIELGGEGKRVGSRIIAFIRQMFSLWHRFLDGELTRRGVRTAIKARGNRLLRYLERNAGSPCKRTRSFIGGLLKVRGHLFTFTEVEGVEPTNNLAEQTIRPAVLWRRKSQGAQSGRGCRFVERMLTVALSCRAQARSVFGFLKQLLSPEHPIPSLVPA